MQKQKHANLSLFADLADADQIRGFKTADERALEREQKRKRAKPKPKPLAAAPATGPACLRCRFWHAPEFGDEYGECQLLVKVLGRVPWAGVEAGIITDRHTARKDWRVEHEPLRIGEAGCCSGFDEIGEEAA